MDHYGIQSAMLGMMITYFTTSRRTGRTQSMIDSLKDGDVVYFKNIAEAKRVQLEAHRKRHIAIECRALRDPSELLSAKHNHKRVFLDHSLIEKLYLDAVKQVATLIASAQTPEPSERRDIEIARWGPTTFNLTDHDIV